MSNGPRSIPRNPSDCSILCKWVFDNFALADKYFVKAFLSCGTCVSVANNLIEKLVSSLELPTKFDERFKVTSVPFFTSDFNSLS